MHYAINEAAAAAEKGDTLIDIGGKMDYNSVAKTVGDIDLKPAELMDELISSGVKCTPDDVIMVTKTSDGLLWLETGNDFVGLQHIWKKHGEQLAGRGIPRNSVPDFLRRLTQYDPIDRSSIPERGIEAIYEYKGKNTKLPMETTALLFPCILFPDSFIIGGNKMHQVASSEQEIFYRYLTLKNTKTGTIDYCFDQSDFPADPHPGFYFMKQGGVYDCKILLFGDIDIKAGFPVADCRVLDPNVKMGNCRFVKVAVGEDIYYVYYKDVRDVVNNGHFRFRWTRKDLIQVNDVLLSDYYVYDFWENE